MLSIAGGVQIRDGMGGVKTPRGEDRPVHPASSRQLPNCRSAGNDKNAQLDPPLRFSLERAIEYIAPDELVEATPKSIRLRKRVLDSNTRQREKKKTEAQLEGGEE